MTDDGILRFVTATTQPILEIERVQEEEQDGPCMEALQTHQPRDGGGPPGAQPLAGLSASGRGSESPLGDWSPSRVERPDAGSPNIYRAELGRWSPGDISAATMLANMATSYLIHTSELEHAHQLTEQLQQALDSRIVIDHAKGR